MTKSCYIKEVLKQHLQDKDKTYRLLSEREALSRIVAVRIRVQKIVEGNLPLNESDYFRLHLSSKKPFRDPQFYGMPKVHKNMEPVPLRPVVSQCGSLLGIPSTYLDYKLQPLKFLVPSYVKDSHHIISLLQKIGTLPLHARLFTCDTVSMYTNIDP